MAISLNKINQTDDIGKLAGDIRRFVEDLEEQLSAQPALIVNTDPSKPLQPSRAGDLSIDFNTTGYISFRILQPNKQYSTLNFEVTSINNLIGFKGKTSSALAASTNEYPNDGDFGIHTNTATSAVAWAINQNGVIKSVALT